MPCLIKSLSIMKEFMKKVFPPNGLRASESSLRDSVVRSNLKSKMKSTHELPAKRPSKLDLTGSRKGDGCLKHGKPTFKFCLNCQVYLCLECVLSQSHFSHRTESKAETARSRTTPDTEQVGGLMAEVKSLAATLKSENQTKQTFFISQTRNNFANFSKELEKCRENSEVKIRDYFQSIEDSLDAWVANVTYKLFALGDTTDAHYRSNLEYESEMARGDIKNISAELSTPDFLQLSFNVQKFEGVKDFCVMKINQPIFLAKFKRNREDDLFLESIHDPFVNSQSKPTVTPKAAVLPRRLDEEYTPFRRNFSSFQSNSVKKTHLKASMAGEVPLKTPKNRKSMVSLRSEQRDLVNQDSSVLIHTEASNLWKDNPIFLSTLHNPAVQKGTLSNRKSDNTDSNFCSTRSKQANEKSDSKLILRKPSSISKFETDRPHSKSTPRNSKSSYEIPLLDFSSKNLTEDEFVNFFSNLKVKTPIQTLDLSRNKITDNFLLKILGKLVTYTITTVVLDFNLLTEESFDHFLAFKSQNDSVETFSVKGNQDISWESPGVQRKIRILGESKLEVRI